MDRQRLTAGTGTRAPNAQWFALLPLALLALSACSTMTNEGVVSSVERRTPEVLRVRDDDPNFYYARGPDIWSSAKDF